MADDVIKETERGQVVAPERVRDDRGVNRVLAWVGIIAGTVFITGAVFFSGYALGAGSGGFHRMWQGGWGGGARGGGGAGCPMMGGDRDERGSGGMMGPGGMMAPPPSPAPRS